MDNQENRTLITETELAERLQVSKKLLQKMRYEGSGPKFIKIGRSVRYHHKDIEVYLAASTRSFTREVV